MRVKTLNYMRVDYLHTKQTLHLYCSSDVRVCSSSTTTDQMGYDGVPTDEPTIDLPPKKTKRRKFYSRKSFRICCSNVVLRSGDLEEKVKEKKNEEVKEEFGVKLKKKLLLCCSNLEIETEEEKEKVLSYLENDTKRSRVVMCFSNVVVGPRSDLGYGAPK